MNFKALAGVRGRPSPSAAVQAAQQQLEAAGDKDAAAHDKAGPLVGKNSMNFGFSNRI